MPPQIKFSLQDNILLLTTEEKGRKQVLQLCSKATVTPHTETAQKGVLLLTPRDVQACEFFSSPFVPELILVWLKPVSQNTDHYAFSLWKSPIATPVSFSSFGSVVLFSLFFFSRKHISSETTKKPPDLQVTFPLSHTEFSIGRTVKIAIWMDCSSQRKSSYCNSCEELWRSKIFYYNKIHALWNWWRAQYIPGSPQNSGQESHYFIDTKGVSNNHHKA